MYKLQNMRHTHVHARSVSVCIMLQIVWNHHLLGIAYDGEYTYCSRPLSSSTGSYCSWPRLSYVIQHWFPSASCFPFSSCTFIFCKGCFCKLKSHAVVIFGNCIIVYHGAALFHTIPVYTCTGNVVAVFQ